MNLTKNDRKVLKLLLENSRMSDSVISQKLKISSQAVGKIRRKLEREIIKSYTMELDYAKLGIRVFAIALSKLTREGLEKGELQVEQKLIECPNMIQIYRLPNQSTTHIILYGFRSLEELDSFFHSSKGSMNSYLENRELYTFSNHSLIKSSPIELFKKIVENPGSEFVDEKLKELESFKRRINKI